MMAKAIFYASFAAFIFGVFGFAALALGEGGFESGLLGAFKFGPILLSSVPLIIPSLFSGFARPKPGMPRTFHLIFYAAGAAAHAVGIAMLAWVLLDGEVRLLGWRESLTLAAAIGASASAWYWLYPERPPRAPRAEKSKTAKISPRGTAFKGLDRPPYDFERSERPDR